jgi:uncharacterized damage-inducible protein DinB
MHTLHKLFRYNAWANRRVFDAVADLDAAALAQDAPGTQSSLEGTLKHLVGVEDIYLMLTQGRAMGAAGDRDAYFEHDLAWFRDRAEEVGRGYAELTANADAALLGRALAIPWIATPLTVEDGLAQVLNHSAQHRAQVLSALGERGRAVPDVDYVLMLQEEQAAG